MKTTIRFLGRVSAWFVILLVLLWIEPLAAEVPGETASLMKPEEISLHLDPAYVKLDEHNEAQLQWRGDSYSVQEVFVMPPWQLMAIFQDLSKKPLHLSRFGNGDALTEEWRQKLAAFLKSREPAFAATQEDLFDPALVLWDPGYIQFQNDEKLWFVSLDRRKIFDGDIGQLSPLEIQQAITVLTGRSYSLEFVLFNLEKFRTQLHIAQSLESQRLAQ